MTVGFIGQGYVGKNYADDFEKRGFAVVRYALEEPYRNNIHAIKECDVVFIAVPTPTTKRGFDITIVTKVLGYVGKGKVAVIKSTILPGTTKSLQEEYPNVTIMYSPEFLSEKTAAFDAAHPFSNIVGVPKMNKKYRETAKKIHTVLPKAPFTLTCDSTEAEIIKYSHNVSAYTQIIIFNMLYDVAQKLGASWETIEKAIKADPFIPNRYASPVHKSGRGAGGHCFIKDFEAFSGLYAYKTRDTLGFNVLRALRDKNIDLLVTSGKDTDILEGVYGTLLRKKVGKRRKK